MLIVEKKPKSIGAEAYKTLRTNIQYASIDDDYRVIAVTSSEPSEGKTTVSSNLAMAIAQGESSVLIVDCDMRKPSVHKRFKLSNNLGLSDIIARKVSIEEVVHEYNSNLSVIPAGKVPPNPSEMLSSRTMSAFLEEMKKHFDYIVLDTPPLQAVTDAQILATKADGTVIVVRSSATKKDALKASIESIKSVNGTIIGLVLNGTEIPKNKYYNYYGDNI